MKLCPGGEGCSGRTSAEPFGQTSQKINFHAPQEMEDAGKQPDAVKLVEEAWMRRR